MSKLLVLSFLLSGQVWAKDCDVTKISGDIQQYTLPHASVMTLFNDIADRKFAESILDCIDVKKNSAKVQPCLEKKVRTKEAKDMIAKQTTRLAEFKQAYQSKKVQWIGVEMPEGEADKELWEKEPVKRYYTMKGLFKGFGADNEVLNGLLTLLFPVDVLFFGENLDLYKDVKYVYLEKGEYGEQFHSKLISISQKFDNFKAKVGSKLNIFSHDYGVIERAMEETLGTGVKFSPAKIETLSMHFMNKETKQAVRDLFTSTNEAWDIFAERDKEIVRKLSSQTGNGIVSLTMRHRTGVIAGLLKSCGPAAAGATAQ